MKRILGIALCLLLVGGILVYYFARARVKQPLENPIQPAATAEQEIPKAAPGLTPVPDVDSRAALILRGQAVEKTAPPPATLEWMEWYKKLSADDRRAWSVAQDAARTPAAPKAPEKQDVSSGSNPVVSDWEVDGPFKVKIVRNYRPMLRIPKDVGVRALHIKTTTKGGGFVSAIGARRAAESIEVDWSAAKVQTAKVDSQNAEGPIPQHVDAGSVLLGGNGGIGIRTDKGGFRVKYDRNVAIYPLAIDSGYRYAFGLEVATHADGIVILDLQEKKFAGRLAIPPAPHGVHVVFNSQTEYLYVLDSGGDWIVLIDLRNPGNLKKD